MATKINRKQLKFDKNPIEAIRQIGDSVVDTAKQTATQEAQIDVNLAWRQLLGNVESASKTQHKTQEAYDLAEGEEIILSIKETKAEIAPGIDYTSEILHSHARANNEMGRELNAKIEELRLEIAKLAKSSKQLEVLVKDVSIESVGSNPGKYHLNFFEWVFATIQIARIRVEESVNWMSTVNSKAARKNYWSLSKKHGTSFMLSGERVVAQQTG